MPINFLPTLGRPLSRIPAALWSNFFENEDLFPTGISRDTGIKIWEENNELRIEAPLPGLSDSDIEITLNQGVLIIRGSKDEEEEDKNRRYYRSSRRDYSFSIALPHIPRVKLRLHIFFQTVGQESVKYVA